MAEHSMIEWTDATWNPITGCSLVSEGCRHCYAATLAATRLKTHPSRAGLARLNAAGEAKFTGEVRFNEQWLDQPLRWKRPRMIFVCAHSDLFHENVPDDWIDRVFAVMALAPQHTFQVLTKRPERALAYLDGCSSAPEDKTFVGSDWTTRWHRRLGVRRAMRDLSSAGYTDRLGKVHELPLPNVWLGTSVEDQAAADERIPHLLAAPAAIRFLSAEPLLGPVDLTSIDPTGMQRKIGASGWSAIWKNNAIGRASIDWVITGGESGPGARPSHPDWFRKIRDDCERNGIAYFHKQHGAWVPAEVYSDGDRGGLTRSMTADGDPFPGKPTHWWSGDAFSGVVSILAGKKAAGRLLDGREWSEMPR